MIFQRCFVVHYGAFWPKRSCYHCALQNNYVPYSVFCVYIYNILEIHTCLFSLLYTGCTSICCCYQLIHVIVLLLGSVMFANFFLFVTSVQFSIYMYCFKVIYIASKSVMIIVILNEIIYLIYEII